MSNHLSYVSFVQIGALKAILYLEAYLNTRNSHVYCPMGAILYAQILLGFCSFRRNSRREGYTFPLAVYSITFTVRDVRNSLLQSVYCVTGRTANSVVFRRSETEQTSRRKTLELRGSQNGRCV